MQDWAKEHDIEWSFHLPYNLQIIRVGRKEEWNIKAIG